MSAPKSSPAKVAAPDGGPSLGGYFLGLATGVILSVLYVRFDWQPPAIFRMSSQVEAAAVSAAVDFDLSDPTRPVEVRQRALATVLSKNPHKIIELDDETGHALLAAWDARAARRGAIRLLMREDAIDKALTNAALKNSLARTHGTREDAELKDALMRRAIADEPFVGVMLDRKTSTDSGGRRHEQLKALAAGPQSPPIR